MKVCANCEVHGVCSEIEPVIDTDGSELEFCTDYCRERYIESTNPEPNTVLIYWVDGDIGFVKRLSEESAFQYMSNYVCADAYKDFNFAECAKQIGLSDPDPFNLSDLIDAINRHNWNISNPVIFYFKEIEQ